MSRIGSLSATAAIVSQVGTVPVIRATFTTTRATRWR
jgi:hypothetical protein